jgi:polyhydroxybutyrate depolymerase
MQNLKHLLFPLILAASLTGSGWAVAAAPQQTLVHHGVERGYLVRVPAEPKPSNERLPLVLVLHGGGGNAAHAEAMTGFTEKANREGFIVVYPEGSSRFKGRLLTWNAGHCCGYAMQNRVDDVAFISALLDQLAKDYPVDPRRIYATGMSNGGMMAHRLGIELAHRFAAIAPVVATLFGDEAMPAEPVSALMLNGMLDQSVPYQGGAPGGRFPDAWDGTPARPALAQAAFWAQVNGCAGTPDTQDRAAWVRSRYRCPDGRAVEAYLIKDDGHAWPGGRAGSHRADTPGASLNGTDLIWNFFKAHAK